MVARTEEFPYIRRLSPFDEKRITRIPFLNIDSLLIPSPYIRDKSLDIDYDHSYVWDEEGELLGYLLVYSDPDKTTFHLYKQVTSPFGRGKGIGSAFVQTLANNVAPGSRIYLYVWEKLISSVDFFLSKGFNFEDTIVYRKMKFHLMSAEARALAERIASVKDKDFAEAEELGKIRHDAKKALRILFDMVSMLSMDNFKKVIEDINREVTALLNTLNTYQDKITSFHDVSIKELIFERVIPFIEASDVPCEISLVLGSNVAPVAGNYLSFSRALINIVSNSLDAIRESGRHGRIEITMSEKDDTVYLAIRDNGIGIEEDRLEKGPDMLPLFVGKTTKKRKTGEGIGTRQIFSTFGPANIDVESKKDEFTTWTINLRKSSQKASMILAEIKTRYVEFIKSTERIGITEESSRTGVASFIWHLRKLEIFSYDLISRFSRYNNVRDIFRNILLYRYGGKDFQFLKTELKKYRIDNEEIRSWLLGATKRIKRNEQYLAEHFTFSRYKGVLFKSYGQAVERTIIFTMDPATGSFLATDRKLAEHMDLVPFLHENRDSLLRGEFIGDVRNLSSPVWLGVWSVTKLEELHERIELIRTGASQLLKMGLNSQKRLSFYVTTYNSSNFEIDTLSTTTLGEMASLKKEDFHKLIVSSEDELHGMVFTD